MNNNPFHQFMIQDPPNLIGRDFLVRQILGGITESQPVSYQVVSFRTMGSTALLKYLSHPSGAITRQEGISRIPHHFRQPNHLILFYLDCNFYYQQEPFSAWMLEKILADGRLGSIEKDIGGNELFAINHLLIQAVNQQKRVVFLFDHFENALRNIPQSEATELRPLVDLSAIITATEKTLVEIKEDAASSWFGGQMVPINLDPLSNGDARILLKAALDPNKEREPIAEYYQLLPDTGRYPYYILKGASQWYELRKRYPNLEQAELKELWASRLLTKDFYSEFFRFWTHIKPTQQESLIQLSKSRDKHNVSSLNRQSLDSLMDMGLVIWERDSYQFFSKLWERFVELKAEEANIENEIPENTGREAGKLFTSREEALLIYLQKHPGEIRLYKDILDAVWHEEDTDDNRHLLRQIIMRVRRKLKIRSSQEVIVTHRQKGYEYRNKFHEAE